MKTMKTLTLAGQTYEIVDEVARRVNTTLTESGVAADAKTVGDKIAEIKESLNSIKDAFYITVDFNNPVPGENNAFKITESAEEVSAAYNSGKRLYAIVNSSDEEVFLLPHVAVTEGTLLFGFQMETTAMAAIYPLGQEYIILEQAELTAEMFGGATPDDITNAIKAIDFPVDSVNGKTGTVQLSAGDVGAVPTTRTVNGKSLNTNITLNAADVGAATEDYVDNKVSALVDSAPGTLDTLNELAAALGDDPNFATTVSNNIASKVPQTRTINGRALNADITLTAADVGALPADTDVTDIFIISTTDIVSADEDGMGMVFNIDKTTADIANALVQKKSVVLIISSLGSEVMYLPLLMLEDTTLVFGAQAGPSVITVVLDMTNAQAHLRMEEMSAESFGAATHGDITNAINAIDFPVDSVNGKTGNVTLTAEDIGALPDDTEIHDLYLIAVTHIAEDSKWNIDKTPTEIMQEGFGAGKIPMLGFNLGEESIFLPLIQISSDATELVFALQLGIHAISAVLDMTTGLVDISMEAMTPETIGAATQEDITNAINAIDFPVDSVNGKTGAVTLTAEDVGAIGTESAGANQYLTSDASGNVQWEEKLAYSLGTELSAFIPAIELTSNSPISYGYYYLTTPYPRYPLEGEVLTVKWGDAEYSLAAHEESTSYQSWAKAMVLRDETGEAPFEYIRFYSPDQIAQYPDRHGDIYLRGGIDNPVTVEILALVEKTKPIEFKFLPEEVEIHLNDFENPHRVTYKQARALADIDPVGTGTFSMNRKADTIIGDYSHAEGYETTASGDKSHAEGNETIADTFAAHAEGSNTTASGQCAHAEGAHSEATGTYSHAEGWDTEASGDNSHAEGWCTHASGYASHAEGSDTSATVDGAHSEGISTRAKGYASHAEGDHAIASGGRSHAEGQGTEAMGSCQHVQGKYNSITSKYAHIVGNGEDERNRSNAHTLDWDGNAWYQGTVETTAIILAAADGKRYKLEVIDGKLSMSEVIE